MIPLKNTNIFQNLLEEFNYKMQRVKLKEQFEKILVQVKIPLEQFDSCWKLFDERKINELSQIPTPEYKPLFDKLLEEILSKTSTKKGDFNETPKEEFNLK